MNLSPLPQTLTRSLVLAVLLLTGIAGANAQPRISYITPDLGTTRYGTYVEIIGPSNLKDNFGPNGFSMNNANDALRVRCLRNSDTNTVKIGPCVVSWDGRMISTIIFVDPDVEPNSDRWQLLDPQYKIPIVVELNGTISQPDTFYIVQPFAMGDLGANPDRVFGEASLGRRSRRGAMLVDSIIMASNARYSVSRIDTDSDTPGNQAYLPFTLLATGNITGRNGAEIHADAEGSNGGPGGGGGGGAYANFALGSSDRGQPGGNGYTGGGPGGYNNSSIPLADPSSKRRPGTGSGESLSESNSNTRGSASLNGMAGGASTSSFENAGGGTGHPFGLSGDGCSDRNTCNTQGGFGGGSGTREGERGGGGGFGEDGASENGRDNGGRSHGNACLVPLAGGSGGASGNPSGTSASSSGGGGGGAVSIHGRMLANFDVYARGASAAAVDVRGGAGSGGGVILGTRLDNAGFGFVTAQVTSQQGSNFLAGGRGRSRYDARVTASPFFYRGPLTDTMTFSLRQMQLSGHGDGSDLHIYLKPETGVWREAAVVTGYVGTWRETVTLPGSDTVYYVAVSQEIPIPRRGEYTFEPEQIFSQSAWNIVQLYGPPNLSAPTDLDLGRYKCEGAERVDSIEIRNDGESPLEIASATWAGAPGFSLVTPTVFPDTIPVGGSKTYVISYTAPIGTNGVQIGQLQLDHNDTTQNNSKIPWTVNVRVDVRSIDLVYLWRGLTGDTLDVGILCVGETLIDQITVTNRGVDSTLLVDYVTTDPSLVVVGANLPFSVAPSASRNLFIRFIANRVGPAVVPTLLYLEDCPEPDTIWVRFEGVASQMTLIGSGQFGVVPVGSTRQTTIELRNDGTADLDIPVLPAVNPPFTLVSAVPTPPTILRPGESMFLTYAYSPTTSGQQTESFRIVSIAFERACADSVEVIMAGTGAAVDIVAEPGSLTFPAITSCQADTQEVLIRNNGGTSVTVLYPAFLNGVDAADFEIVQQPANDTLLPAGGSARYLVAFAPRIAANATRTASLHVRTDQAAVPEVEVGLTGTRATLDLQGARVVDLGLIPVGLPTTRTETYTNVSGVEISIDRITSSRPTDLSAAPQTFTMADAATQDVDITVTPTTEGSWQDTLYVVSEDPCLDSFAIIVRYTSESPELGVQNALDFGILSNCEVAVDTVIIANTSALPIDIIDVAISGPDAALFAIGNPTAATNVTLDPLDTIELEIQFDPRGSTDGAKTAQLITRARINNQPTPFQTALSGERRTTIPSTPTTVVFGDVDVLSTSRLLVTIVNVGVDPIRVTEIVMAGTAGGVFVLTTPATPLTLQPGERADVEVVFTPDDTRFYQDSILVRFDQPCADVRPIPVSGTGRLNVEFGIILPEQVIDPADDNVRLPVRGVIATGAADEVKTSLELLITYDSPLFVAQDVTLGTITRNEVVAGRTQLEIEIPDVTLTKTESTLFEILGQGTIGPLDSTDLLLERAEAFADGTTPKVRPTDGWLMLTICEEGGDRLIQRAGTMQIIASPTPATESLELVVSVFERGTHILQVIDVTGAVVYTESWNHTPGESQRVMHLDARSLGSGTYQVRLTTPTRQRSVPALILH